MIKVTIWKSLKSGLFLASEDWTSFNFFQKSVIQSLESFSELLGFVLCQRDGQGI